MLSINVASHNKVSQTKGVRKSAVAVWIFFTFLLFLTYALARDFLEVCMGVCIYAISRRKRPSSTQVNSDVKKYAKLVWIKLG